MFPSAGEEPLTHPDIVEIVRMVKEYGMKPIINTNGKELTKELLYKKELRLWIYIPYRQ